MDAYLEVFRNAFSGNMTPISTVILGAGVILLIVGIVHLLIPGRRGEGIFLVLDALFFTPALFLSANMEMDISFYLILCGAALLLNILNWFLNCRVTFGQFMKGILVLVVILVMGSGALGFVGGFFIELLPKDLPSLAQFLVLIFFLVLEAAAYIGSWLMDPSFAHTSTNSSHYEDPVLWATGDEVGVDTVAMSADDSSDSGADSPY